MAYDTAPQDNTDVLDLEEMLRQFNARFEAPTTDLLSMGLANSIQTLERIYIPGLVAPLQTPNADGGVNYSMVHSSSSRLLIIIQRYSNMFEGDWIEVFWGNDTSPVASDRVLKEHENQNFAMFVAADKIPSGINDLYCTVTRNGSNNQESSVALRVLVRLIFPGGTDPEPDRPGHQNLKPPMIETPASGVIGEPEAIAGVKVTISSYPNMRDYDRVRLSWGGHFVEHQVQPAQVGQAIVVTVPEAVIRAAGDSDELGVTYRVVDEVQNQSSDWSERASAKVEVGKGSLRAPYIINPDPAADPADVIDLEKLDTQDLTVEVDTPEPDFVVDDIVQVTWTGTTALGQDIAVITEPQKIVRPGRTLYFTIPNDSLLSLGGGHAVASYVVTREAAMLQSKRAFVSIAGAAQLLPAPTVREAIDGALDPTLATATVVIAANVLERDDLVRITWLGTRPNGTPLLYQAQRTVSSSQHMREMIFTVPVAANLAPLDGGTLDVSYKVTRPGLERPLDSSREVLRVGEAQSELPAPRTDPVAEGGLLDPTEHPNGLDVVIAPYPNMNDRQRVYLEWQPTVGAPFFDDVLVVQGTETRFYVEQAQLLANNDGDVTVSYRVVQNDQPDRSSAVLTFRIDDQPAVVLPSPLVLEAVGGVLNPIDATLGATVQVPAAADLKAGDEVVVHWVGDKPGGVTEVSEFVLEDQGNEGFNLTVGFQYVVANADGNVNVHYQVYRQAGGVPASAVLPIRVQSAALPLPTFVEAVGNNLNLDDVLAGATVLIEAAAQLREHDTVTVEIESPVQGGSISIPAVVPAGGDDRELRVTVPYASINPSNGVSVVLSYRITRSAGGQVETSPPNTYMVNRVIGAGTLRIFGARYNASTYRASGSSRVISAYNAATSQPILAEWQYQGDVGWTAGYTWLDRQPQRVLRVRTTTDAVLLNPANVIGNGRDNAVDGMAAYTAMLDTAPAGLYSMFGWGNAAHGANVPPVLITYDDVVEVSCTRSAYAARRADGYVACWGNPAEGGTLPPDETHNFVEVRGNATAFVGRRTDGSLSAWGESANGADIPPEVIQQRFTAVYPGGLAFAAAKADDNCLVAWGDVNNGGLIPPEVADLTDVVMVKGNYAAFAARRANNTVVGWGNAGYGGTVPDTIAARFDLVTLEAATSSAFSALTSDGQVVAWGDATNGGTVPPDIAALSDIVEVTSTWHAFCARRRNGHVVAWGEATNGGDVPAEIAQLSDIVQVTGSAWSFAALRRNGTVVAWGNPSSGGDTEAVAGQLTNVRAVYANTNSFTALTSDGRVVTWGEPAGGGDSSAAQPVLRGRLLVGRPDPDPQAVRAPDNELRAMPH